MKQIILSALIAMAEHIRGLAVDDKYAHDDVVVRIPAEKG
jgi:hypothetical protein